jgi:hypothetical protein
MRLADDANLEHQHDLLLGVAAEALDRQTPSAHASGTA